LIGFNPKKEPVLIDVRYEKVPDEVFLSGYYSQIVDGKIFPILEKQGLKGITGKKKSG